MDAMPHPKSQVPKKLREAAVQEVQTVKDKKLKEGALSFDVDHRATQCQQDAAEQFDRENWVAKYPGQNIPHIGNGPGGPR
jgi:hypothetical protein